MAGLNTPEPAGLSLIAIGADQVLEPSIDFGKGILGFPAVVAVGPPDRSASGVTRKQSEGRQNPTGSCGVGKGINCHPRFVRKPTGIGRLVNHRRIAKSSAGIGGATKQNDPGAEVWV